jgi:mannose/cellobiose epimerase-like protein (N-acyl-D-glucosamine 2-epimerase family)
MTQVPALIPWLLDVVVPFWAATGRDRAGGGFVERLGRDGRPAPDDYKRIRVQARQIYAMCHARLLGAPEGVMQAAWAGFDFLTRHCWDEKDGGFFHTVTRNGAPLDRRRDTYDHAFVLLAMAWLHRASGDARALDWAARTIGFLDHALADPRHGGYQEDLVEGRAAIALPRRQNPHMHLFEALLAMHEATGEGRWLDRARAILDLFLGRWRDADGTLGEYFTADWQPAPGAEGLRREPGHHFEWVWLLDQYCRLSGEERVLEPADRLYRFALAHGIDTAPGMVPAAFDEIDAAGALTQPTKRLWPQTEALKAFLARAERLDDADARARARAHLAMMFTRYVGAGHALWRDQLDRAGAEVSTTVPASTLYHLFLATAEAARVLDL